MMNPDSQEVCYISQSSQDETSFLVCPSDRNQQNTKAMMGQGLDIDCEEFKTAAAGVQERGITNLQEAFFKTDKSMAANSNNLTKSPSDNDSVEAENFSFLCSDSIIETFG